jgi:hypothetical protein
VTIQRLNGVARATQTKYSIYFAVRALVFVVLALALLAGFKPFSVKFMKAGLSPSWNAASTWAQAHQLAFGTDFIFTSGPLSSLYHHSYAFWFTPVIAALSAAAALYCALALDKLGGRGFDSKANDFWITGASLLALVASMQVASMQAVTSDALLLFLPLLTALLIIADKANFGVIAIGIFLSAAASLSKFSILPYALGATIVCDIFSLNCRRAPVATATLIIAIVALFAISGQNIGQLSAYLTSSLEVAGAYAQAMSVPASKLELGSWFLLALIVTLTVARVAYLEMRNGGGLMKPLSKWCLLFGFLFTAMKAGFVRHDPTHSLKAWASLWMVTIVFALPAITPRAARRYSFVLIALSAIVPFAMSASTDNLLSFSPLAPLYTLCEGWQQVLEGVKTLAEPKSWMARLEQEEEEAERTVRAVDPMPNLVGTVDIIADRQSAVIAAGLRYAPRPTIQEYTTYSEALVEHNRNFFAGSRAPEFLIFSPGSIDGRHPASAEGALWPLFLQRYERIGEISNALILKKRAVPLENILSEESTQLASLGESIALADQKNLFVKIKVQKTVLGKLMEVFFKPPLLTLVVTYKEGGNSKYRMIPGQIGSGMVLAPTISTANEYSLFASGQDISALMRFPTSFLVEAGSLGGLAYREQIGVAISTIDRSGLHAASP